MASTAEVSTFKHEPLPDASTYIRLLEVVSADPAGDVPAVHCKLTSWPKTSAPSYAAISYTWGDPGLVETILINGKRMEVRRNCEDVLRQQCWTKGGHFWIDAICINQADNDEKSFQVARMGEVYRDARQTLACVGGHADDSEFLFETLHEHRRRYMDRRRHKEHGGSLSDIIDLTVYLSRVSIPKYTLVRPANALSSFLKRPYFQRVWIYQELFFGNDVELCCGDKTVELSLIWALYRTIRKWVLSCEPSILPRSMSVPRSDYYDDGDKMMLRAVTMEKEPLEISSVISSVQELQCEDPRDRVFGTLAMVDWEGGTPIRPDYHMDPLDLAVEVLQKIKYPSRQYLLWVLQDTITMARLVGLLDKSSRRLADEILARRPRGHKASRIFAEGISRKIDSKPTRFWGCRIYYHDAGWHVSLDPVNNVIFSEESALRHENSTDPANHNYSLVVQKWSKGTAWDKQETAILLPEDARPQDWLLIPDRTSIQPDHTPVALIARDSCDGQPQIAGKALFAFAEERPWLALDLAGYKFRVHVDHVDAMVLAHSCNWNASPRPFPSSVDEPHKFQVDGYFQTRLCSERSGTWAERMHWGPRY